MIGRIARTGLLLLALLPVTGCATTTGTLAGPITGPITFWRHTHGTPDWVKALLVPFTIPAGPFIGMLEGARADYGWLQHQEYGVYPHPPFEIVLDPANTAFDRPPLPRGGTEVTYLDEGPTSK